MAASPSFPTYKWWETDDKTKRLYTELLAEKLSSPRKTRTSALSRKPSNGKDAKTQLTSSPKRDTSKVIANPEEGGSRKTKPEKGETEDHYGKYTFETITIDTLAKYEYIKSPRKRGATTIPVSCFESTEKADCTDVDVTAKGGYKDNKELIDKFLPPIDESKEGATATSSNGHYLISQKLSSTKNDLQRLKTVPDEKGTNRKEAAVKKASRTKLAEIPEYTSSESSDSADEKMLLGIGSSTKKCQTLPKPKDVTDNKRTQSDNTDKPLKIEELTTKYQFLSDEVAQLEFKMFEFSDDIKKLKQAMGFKTEVKREDSKKEITDTKGDISGGKTNDYGITRQKSFTYADKFNSKAMLMKQQASPSKMLTVKPGGLLAAKISMECTGKEDAMAELKKNGALSEIINKIKEQEFSEDEIQEILRCAKDKYVDKPNYLQELGYGRKND